MAQVTKDNYEEFKKAYSEAVDYRRNSFMFEGQAVMTDYAKCVIQYIDSSEDLSI